LIRTNTLEARKLLPMLAKEEENTNSNIHIVNETDSFVNIKKTLKPLPLLVRQRRKSINIPNDNKTDNTKKTENVEKIYFQKVMEKIQINRYYQKQKKLFNQQMLLLSFILFLFKQVQRVISKKEVMYSIEYKFCSTKKKLSCETFQWFPTSSRRLQTSCSQLLFDHFTKHC